MQRRCLSADLSGTDQQIYRWALLEADCQTSAEGDQAAGWEALGQYKAARWQIVIGWQDD